MRKILITGGMGYVGGRLAQHLEKDDANSVVITTRKTAEKPLWLLNSSVMQVGDWRSDEALRAICEGVDVVIHLAGMNATASSADPVGAMDFNGVATARLLRAAIAENVKRIVYFSTAHVYMSPLKGSISESTCPVSKHPYATSHRAAEDVVLYAHQQKQIDGIVIRLSNAFGAPAHAKADCWSLFVNDLCRQAVTQQKMSLVSSGVQRRDFITMEDVCAATAHLLEFDIVQNNNPIFNVGGKWSPTLWEMALQIQSRCTEVLGFTPELSRNSEKKDEKPADLDYFINALQETGFSPAQRTNIELDGLLMYCKTVFQEKN
jgi:UDP-glucose 4-epimerase